MSSTRSPDLRLGLSLALATVVCLPAVAQAYIGPGAGFVAGQPSEVVSTSLTVQTFLVGVNYKFNFGGPVVAKY